MSFRIIKSLLSMVVLFACANLWAFSSENSQLSARATMAVNLLQKNYASNEPGASYLISHKGNILASGAIGMANMDWNIPLADTSLIRIGSMSKSITAIAILQLVESGKLDLDIPISTYAPDLPNHMGIVTLRQLLSHRSGIADHAFDKALIPFVWQPMTTDQVIELQKDKKPTFKAGEKYEYVNFNYVLIAHVIEKVTSRSFIQFANEDIFKTYGLSQSAYDQPSAIIPNRAEFFLRTNDGLINHAADVDLSHVSAAGALLSSPKDMLKWITMLTDGKLISDKLMQEAWTAYPLPDGTETKYGLGFNITSTEKEFGLTSSKSQKYIYHTGLTPGAQGAYGYAVDSEIFVIVLSNLFYWPADTGALVDEMMKLMLQSDDK